MKKKVLMISAIVLILLISVATVAVCMEMQRKDEVDSDLYYFDKTAIIEKLYTTPSGIQKILTYSHSLETASGKPLHYYKDVEENLYYFNEKGELIGHKQTEKPAAQAQKEEVLKNDNIEQSQLASSEKNESDKTNEPTKEQNQKTDTPQGDENEQFQIKLPAPHDPPTSYKIQAPTNPEQQAIIDAARKYAVSIYGEEYISKFSYSNMVINEAIQTANVFFYIRYKERIITECCIVTLYENKTIGSNNAIISGKGIDNDFNSELLTGIEIDEVEQFAIRNVKEKYAQGYQSCTIENDIVVVRNDKGGFDLCVIANVETQSGFQPIREKFYYPLG